MADNIQSIKYNHFSRSELNALADYLIGIDTQFRKQLKLAEQAIRTAFELKYMMGKAIFENYEMILEECGSQKAFAESIGQTESQISNALRGYKAFHSEGVEAIQDAYALLEARGIKPTSQNYDKIGSLLNEPTEERTQKEQLERDEKRLIDLQYEADEIRRRNEAANSPVLGESQQMIEYLDNMRNYLANQDIFSLPFTSQKYLEFVRTFGIDVVTEEPVERCDPHHTNLTGGSDGMGMKPPDWMTIPVSRNTHNAIETGLLQLTERDISRMLIRTMATFIVTLLKRHEK